MNLARFFVDRPIFAAVVSIVIFVSGLIAIPQLPISEYPDVVPPTVQVAAMYPGANPKTLSETVAAPLEEAINGVERLMYVKSVASSDGAVNVTVTFEPGTDPNAAQVQVQNRVAQAMARLPEEVRRQGVVTEKQAPNLALLVHLLSPDGRHDSVYLRNYATLRVRDELTRIAGVGGAQLFGGGDYAMRVWLDPGKVAARGLTPGDVLRAIQEQNIQVSTGQLGAPPTPSATAFLLSINAPGRLVTETDFEDIVVRTGEAGELTRLRDVARVELGASSYSLRSLLDNKPAVAIGIFQAPGSNVVEMAQRVRAKMAELARDFPPGVEWRAVYDPTTFVRQSIASVIRTLLEAALLVVIVVIIFLKTWRASVIPLLAVPVSIVGTFAVLYLLGFTINTLTLFGLVLAIGIVVDDAIVVVENVERSIADGLPPRAAAHQAMREVSGPIVAVALVLCAVFVPMTFMSGLTGQFFRQFAATIAISTVISAINSLTLSPALAALLLRPHPVHGQAGPPRRIRHALGWPLRAFDRAFGRTAKVYGATVGYTVHRRGAAFAVYGLAVVLAVVAFRAVPGGFVPTQDKMYLIAMARLPEGASLDRTEAVAKEISARALATEGVEHAIAFPGFNVAHFTNTPNSAAVFITLSPSETRSRTAQQIADELNGKLFGIRDAFAFSVMPPPIGIGTGAGFSLFVRDRAGRGDAALLGAVRSLSGALAKQPGFYPPFSSYQPDVPQLALSVDRAKAKAQGIALTDLFATLQIYLGSTYVNDFNRFGRTYQVIAQADGPFRARAEQISELRTRNRAGQMVPIGSVVDIHHAYGPDPVVRYNGVPSADLAGAADPAKLSSEEAIAAILRVAPEALPPGFDIAWTDLSYQQVGEGRGNLIVFPLAILLVFLVLAALYESWTLPLAILLIVPVCLLAALTGVWLAGGDRNVFVQIGLVVLMGLATKNAILIVEFARELERRGRTTIEAAIEAAKLRLRPIVMTSLAFIAGVIPLMISTGAGAEIRRAMGITVFAGMIGVTLFGLVLTPVFYVALRKLSRTKLTATS